MPRRRHQKRSDRSDFPVSSPQPVSNVSRQDFDSLLDQVQGLLEKQKYEDALALIDSAPSRFKLRPELMLVRALVLMSEGEVSQSHALLNEIEKKHPKYYPLYYHQGLMYMTLLWPAHALRAVRKIPRWYLEDEEMRSDVEELTAAASTLIESLADELSVAQDKAEKVSYSNERAQAFNVKGEYTTGEQSAQDAIRLAPNWTSPRNNRAYALYFSGRCAEAIEAAEETLTLDSENLHTLNHLATFHAGLGNAQAALGYAQRLLAAVQSDFREADAWEIVISGLSVAEDDESLYKLAQEKKLPVKELSANSSYTLGVAAYRAGDQRTARRLWQSAEKTGYEPATAALASLKKDPQWPPGHLAYSLLWPETLMDRWIAILDGIEADEPTRSQQKEIDSYIRRYPFVIEAIKRMLWEETAHEAALTMLEFARHPAGYAELMRFGTSDCGSDQDRMEAIFTLERAGQIENGTPVKFWNAEKQEWTEVSIFGQRIEDVEEYDIAPEVAELINRARGEDPPGAIELLERAVRLDPNCAIAIHNLGINYILQGEEEKGEALIRRSVEVDPGYLFGYASLARLETQDENYEKAIEYLDKITRAEMVPLLAAIQAQQVWINIAIGQKEYDRARNHLGLLMNLDPDNDYSDLENRLSLLETFSGVSGFFSNWQRDYAHKTHKKLLKSPIQPDSDLVACLGRVTREALVATCRSWHVNVAGKKAELIARLSQAILEDAALKAGLVELEPDERKALRWVLEEGGWRSWQGFIEMFGDDMDESPSWEHHEPETVPGRLKMMGLLTAGTCEGEHVAFIASDLRPLLRKLLPEAD